MHTTGCQSADYTKRKCALEKQVYLSIVLIDLPFHYPHRFATPMLSIINEKSQI